MDLSAVRERVRAWLGGLELGSLKCSHQYCRHPLAWHEHYRVGLDCSLCECSEYRVPTARSQRVLERVAAWVRYSDRATTPQRVWRRLRPTDKRRDDGE